MTMNADLLARRAAAIPKGVGLMNPIFAERAENSELWDVEGRRFIDFAAGIAVVNTGHRHPRLVQAITDQLGAFTHTCHHVAPYESYVHLAERLIAAAPGDFEKKTCFVTTGAEAVENAIKIARAHTGRDAVIAFRGGFHGRTYLGMSLTGKVAPYRTRFGAMMPDVHHVRFPSELHGISVEDTLSDLAMLFKTEVEPARVAAIILEPVQGEGGFYPAPTALWQALRALCDAHGIVLIADEIQTGFARTGTLFAVEHSGVAPDLIVMAKGLAGGMPLAAVTGKAEIMSAPEPGGLGGTYGGNPLGIAAAHAVLDVIQDEGLCARANVLGDRLVACLRGIQKDTPALADIRARGFMVAAEFMRDGVPDGALTARIQAEARARGLLLLTCGMHGNVIRFLAPLTIQDAVMDEALQILAASVAAAQEG